MRQLFSEYGKVIITSVVAAFLIFIIFNVQQNGKAGVFNIIGSYNNVEENSYDSYTDTEKVANLTDCTLSTQTLNHSVLHKNQEYDLPSMFEGVDNLSNTFPVTVLSITNSSGEEEYTYSKKDEIDVTAYVFKKTGVYTITIQTIGNDNQKITDEYIYPIDK